MTGLLLDSAIEEDLLIRHLQVADAARATLGVCVRVFMYISVCVRMCVIKYTCVCLCVRGFIVY